ncbi:MAG: PKD domain-containing protein, partial [bacterium]|nr:PKD domain-containing protein [bacterium]
MNKTNTIRSIIIIVLTLLFLQPLWGRISANPANPKINRRVSFHLTSRSGRVVLWSFGDGSKAQGGTNITHTFKRSGTFTVSARYFFDGWHTDRINLRVSGKQKISVPIKKRVVPIKRKKGTPFPKFSKKKKFKITGISLHFNDNTSHTTVNKNFTPLFAYADISYTGTGRIAIKWSVDKKTVNTTSHLLGPGGRITVASSRKTGLPTAVPGKHKIQLQVIRPSDRAIGKPRISYTVGVSQSISIRPAISVSPSIKTPVTPTPVTPVPVTPMPVTPVLVNPGLTYSPKLPIDRFKFEKE